MLKADSLPPVIAPADTAVRELEHGHGRAPIEGTPRREQVRERLIFFGGDRYGTSVDHLMATGPRGPLTGNHSPLIADGSGDRCRVHHQNPS
jgi:hypothetical protein